MRAHWIAEALRWLAWFVAIGALYLVVVDQPVPDEFVSAAVAAVLGASAVALIRSPRYPGWIGHVPMVLRAAARIPRDSIAVTGAILRSVVTGREIQGTMERIPFDRGEQDDPAAMLRRSFVTLAVSLPPNSFVIRFEERSVLTHRLR